MTVAYGVWACWGGQILGFSIDSRRRPYNYQVCDIYIFIHHNNDVTQKKVPVSIFGYMYTHVGDASAHQILQK